MFIINDDEFCFLWVEFQFHTIHPLLNMTKKLSKLSKTGSYCQVLDLFGGHQLQMVGDIETGNKSNNVTEGAGVKGKKEGAPGQNLGYTIGE